MARDHTTAAMSRRATVAVAGVCTAALALAGCGVSVAGGGQNAATHPASGIWESNTVGGAGISGRPSPRVPSNFPSNQAPSSAPAGTTRALGAIRGAVGKGGCWENAHAGNYYGAYNQWFWWMGECNDTVAMVSVELFRSASEASRSAHHPTNTAVLGRFIDGAVLVTVYGNAPGAVATAISGVAGLKPVSGYGYSA